MSSPERAHRAPSQPLPPRAADCHMHVFGPFAHFPLAPERAYNVAEAPLAAHEKMKRAVGLERTVLVQASGHGIDNRALLAALAQLGPRGRAVAVIEPQTPRRELESLHAAGVRGLRLNFQTLRERYAGDAGSWFAKFEELAAPLGWHLQLFCGADMLAGMESVLLNSKTPVVIDHMGLPDAGAGVAQPGFQAVLRLLRSGNVWVKLAGADRITRGTGNLRDAIPYMQALASAAPERLVWGSDWPNIGFHSRQPVHDDEILPYRELDAGELLDILAEAIPDQATRRAILADNPQRLYGFGR
ncbi:MAG TPA: amidohydrolase family protein [Burkholderiales bacterium]|nr:amidohydrolase family protein [Burkholderiales bacterium]